MYSSSVGQPALLLYVSCSALLVAPVPALLRGPKPSLLVGFSLVVLAYMIVQDVSTLPTF